MPKYKLKGTLKRSPSKSQKRKKTNNVLQILMGKSKRKRKKRPKMDYSDVA